ncbi:MAG: hypothetical protein RMJ19_00155 [Gemmatales bacterium]|nr:hypothetical protein [Gemmatales bacterium]MCS7158858.1 hypothetical protein [Gemmatales bacterium]MDW8174057.1 hypothetical protein [Gemmatales bacterium]MDW8223530.1 hypothetical protein [Gemmatales bacterium]
MTTKLGPLRPLKPGDLPTRWQRVSTPLIAFGLAVVLWLYMRSRDLEVLDNYPVPVEITVAAAQADWYELELGGASEVRVSFIGPPSRIRDLRTRLQSGQFRISRIISVPEERQADARYVEVIRLDQQDLEGLPGVQAVIAEKTNRIPVTLRRIIEKQMPVQFQHTGGERVERAVVEPSTVLVRGPKEVLDREEVVPTQLYQVPLRAADEQSRPVEHTASVPLVSELGGRPIRALPERVQVRLVVRPKRRLIELPNIPVHFLTPAGFPFRPQFTSPRAGVITLRVLGPAADPPAGIKAYVDFTTPGRTFARGLYPEETIQILLPPGYELAQESPRISIELVPSEGGTSAPASPLTVPRLP